MTDESRREGVRSTFLNLPAAKRRRVVRAALEEFVAGSYEQANLDRIATRASIPKGSLYQYFDGKAGMLQYIVREGLDQAFRLFESSLAEASPADVWEMLFHVFTFLPRMHRDRPDLACLYVRVGLLTDAPVRDSALPRLREMGSRFTALVLDRGIREGSIRTTVDREAAAWMIDAAAQEYHRATLLPGGALARLSRRRQEQKARAIIQLLADALGPGQRSAARGAPARVRR